MKPIGWLAIIALIVIGAMFYFGGDSDKLIPFAECLTEKGATFYGSYECGHCLEQKKEFGAAMEKINYIECGPINGPHNPVCTQAGVTGFPTWFINEEKLGGKQPLTALAEKTGCQLPQE